MVSIGATIDPPSGTATLTTSGVDADGLAAGKRIFHPPVGRSLAATSSTLTLPATSVTSTPFIGWAVLPSFASTAPTRRPAAIPADQSTIVARAAGVTSVSNASG